MRRLAEAVRREGYSVWWDDELPPHLSYSDVIAEEIGRAKAAIVVWSEQSAASEWVRAEADLARNQKKLIQTSIDSRMPPMPFNQLHFVSIGDWRGEDDHPGWRRVKESLAALCRGESAAARAYAFPSTPPRAAPPAVNRAGAGRFARIAVVALLLLGLVGGALFWLTWRPSDPAAPSPGAAVAPAGSAPRLSAPGVEPRATMPPAPPEARADTDGVGDGAPAARSPPPRPGARPFQPLPDRAQSVPNHARIANMRRYCSNAGRGTRQCRQFRQRMNVMNATR